MILSILQVRSMSSRLRGKAMLPLSGRPLIEREIERVRRARRFDRLIIATSNDPSDDELAMVCGSIGIECFRGSLADVLDRFYCAAIHFKATAIVRLTGDCPLIDPEVVDHVIESFVAAAVDYASNTIQPTYPDGLDVEVMTLESLTTAWREAEALSEREHVTSFIWSRPNRFRLLNVSQDIDLSAMRWTVDSLADYEFVRCIYDRLYSSNPQFTTEDVHALLNREPHLALINASQQRNEGYDRSLALDRLPVDSH
jgi:spore coat polysaccharide biosynthesis protein SpsF